MPRLSVGQTIDMQNLETINSTFIDIPFKTQITHLQFRRFSGCPICTLHLQSFVQRHIDLVDRGIHEVAVFHSSKDVLLTYEAITPFAIIADPNKQLYQQFGVEKSVASVFHPAALSAAVRGFIKYRFRPSEKFESYFGLPADFLIDKDGTVLACNYGKHADDHWSVDEVITLASRIHN